jgi:CRISPR-associated protein Cas1
MVDNIGHPVVKINPLLSQGLTILRKQQLRLSGSTESLKIMKTMLLEKVQGQLSNLAWWSNRKIAIASQCDAAKQEIIASFEKLEEDWERTSNHLNLASNSLRSWEAFTARCYWKGVSALITSEGWRMEKRSYRPAEDEFNASLNYLYGMLYNQVESALTCAGLDSQIGLWHRDNYQTPSLSFDAIEPLRPKIDRLLAEMIMTGKIEPSWFETNEKYGYLAGKKGKAVLITSFNNLLEERIKMNGKITAFKNHILQMGYYIKNVIQNNSSHES